MSVIFLELDFIKVHVFFLALLQEFNYAFFFYTTTHAIMDYTAKVTLILFFFEVYSEPKILLLSLHPLKLDLEEGCILHYSVLSCFFCPLSDHKMSDNAKSVRVLRVNFID